MNDVPVLRDLGLVLASATVLLILTRRFHLPSLLAYILAGIVLGPVLGILVVSESLDLFSELGVALLLFLVGLELGFEKLFAYVMSGNARALTFYTKLGFRTVGTAKRQARIGQRYVDEVIIEKFL